MLAVSPFVGALACLVVLRALRWALRRGTRRLTPVQDAQWGHIGRALVGQGANDAQKAVGVIAAVLLAHGTTASLQAPLWATAAASLAMTAGGPQLGGWRIVRTIGRRIYDLRPLDALASQTGSAAVIVAASALGAPVSSTHVVSSSVVGAGIGRRRWSHPLVGRRSDGDSLGDDPARDGARRGRPALDLEVALVKVQRWFLPGHPM